MKIAAAVASLVLGFVILFQSCMVTGLGSLAKSENITGPGGMLAGLLLMIAGGFAFQLPKVSCVMSLVCALLASMEGASGFSDMKIWAVICVGLAFLEMFAARPKKAAPPVS